MYNSLLHPQLRCLDIRTAGLWCKSCLRHKWPSFLHQQPELATECLCTNYVIKETMYSETGTFMPYAHTLKKIVLPAISPRLSFFFCSGQLSVGYTVTAIFCFAGCRWRWVGSLQASLHSVWVVVLGKCVHILEIRTCPLHWKVTKHSLNSNMNRLIWY